MPEQTLRERIEALPRHSATMIAECLIPATRQTVYVRLDEALALVSAEGEADAILARQVQDEAVRVCISRAISLLEDGPQRQIGVSNEAFKCAAAIGLNTSRLTQYRPDQHKIESEVRAARGGDPR